MAIAPRLTVTLAVVPADKPTIVALAELEAAMARLRRLADTNDQGRDACRHRAPGNALTDYRRADIPAPADPAAPYGPPFASLPAPAFEVRDRFEGEIQGVPEVEDLDLEHPKRIRGGQAFDIHALHAAGVAVNGPLHSSELGLGALEVGAHSSSLSVGQAPDETGPDNGAPGFLRPGAVVPTVGEPADIRMGSSVPCVEVGGGSVEGVVHGAPSAGFDLERFEIAWPDDSAGNPDLVCTWCDDVLCEVEQGDTILTLVSVCESHVCGPAPVVLP